MFINRKIIILLIILTSLTLIVFYGIEKKSGFNYHKEMPADFNFIAKLDFDTYTIDTYNNSLIKIIDWEKDTLIGSYIMWDFVVDLKIYSYNQ